MSSRDDLRVSTRVMYDELQEQRVPVRIVDAASSLLEFTDQSGQNHLLFSTLSDKASAVGLTIANNKRRTSLLARRLGITMPPDTVCKSLDEAAEFLRKYSRIVIKPLDNSGGTGVTTRISSITALKNAYAYARRYSNDVIAQQHVIGRDFRLLIVAGTFCSAVERRPAHIAGDGQTTIRDLITTINQSEARSDGYMTTLSKINLDSAKRFLGKAIDSIPPQGKSVQVVGPANLSLGGTAHEATDKVTPAMIADAEKIARRLCLGLCGVDMIWNETTGRYYLIEVNATPGLDLHNDPFWQTTSDAATRYVSWLIDPAKRMVRS